MRLALVFSTFALWLEWGERGLLWPAAVYIALATAWHMLQRWRMNRAIWGQIEEEKEIESERMETMAQAARRRHLFYRPLYFVASIIVLGLALFW